MSAAVPAVPAAAPPTPVPLARVTLAGAVLVALAAGALLLLDRPAAEVLAGASAVLAAVSAAVFCLGAVTVAGFVAGAGLAGVVLLVPGSLPPTLAATVVLALVCGVAPGWVRVEAWQAARAAGAAEPPAPGRLRGRWRTDRVLAAWLVLAFPPALAAAAEAFVSWSAGS
ncbi:hypothetical protein SAMN05660690_2057 [Geodermatophilus telluris]|uniref:Uncharacterized protein n=1 Tax=Geodermatophilus telluris TaxID=1190417 RepID=A0A1G6MV71_9ACTN|nr:hypothetical protein [Geodermatophilus telluris]SDC59453.1 hypothetical protein SAMN05660690_2057 [Geodermatophilus telluris]